MANWIRTGACNNCGECCKRIRVDMKSSSNPQSYCVYTFKQQGKTYCEIKEAYDANDQEFLDLLPPSHYAFWTDNCPAYPDPNDLAHCPPRHTLPDKCSHELMEVD